MGDFETKVHRAIEFLEDGDRIKVTVRFRGRELTHPDIGRSLLAKFGDAVKDHGVVDRMPILEGKSMFMTLASVHKPRVHEHKLGGHRAEGDHPLDAVPGSDADEAAVTPQAAPATAAPEEAAAAAIEQPKPAATPKAAPAAKATPVAEEPAAAPAAVAAPEPIAEPTPVADTAPVKEPAPTAELTPVPEAAPVGE